MNVVHFTADLMMSSQLSQSVRRRGGQIQMVQRMDQLFERLGPETTLLVVDLQAMGWSAAEFQSRRTVTGDATPVVGYAQHVLPELLEEARQAGVETVLTRGQFANSIEQILDV
jgi:hypothetical protein